MQGLVFFSILFRFLMRVGKCLTGGTLQGDTHEHCQVQVVCEQAFPGCDVFHRNSVKENQISFFSLSCFQDIWKQMLLIHLCFFDEDEPMRLTSVKKVDWVFRADY